MRARVLVARFFVVRATGCRAVALRDCEFVRVDCASLWDLDLVAVRVDTDFSGACALSVDSRDDTATERLRVVVTDLSLLAVRAVIVTGLRLGMVRVLETDGVSRRVTACAVLTATSDTA